MFRTVQSIHYPRIKDSTKNLLPKDYRQYKEFVTWGLKTVQSIPYLKTSHWQWQREAWPGVPAGSRQRVGPGRGRTASPLASSGSAWLWGSRRWSCESSQHSCQLSVALTTKPAQTSDGCQDWTYHFLFLFKTQDQLEEGFICVQFHLRIQGESPVLTG